MKIISWNVNGLRSVIKKGFLEWFRQTNPDILCLQEIKIDEKSLPEEININEYNLYFNFSKKKGYSGILIFTKEKPLNIEYKCGFDRFDLEGRFLRLDFNDFVLINVYIPHGGRKKENLNYKLEVYDFLINYLKKIKDKKIVLIGDFNVAYEEIDLANPKQNKNNIMFTFEERDKLDRIHKEGFIDSFRFLNNDKKEFTWWPYRNNLRERNIGWRIDYIFISESLTADLRNSKILTNVIGSDHCPIFMEIE
ncbi:MAG: exodeoxyribonuclease III [Nanoarchaeota archaeon]|nr:exodeoxyribonuclease III [Nanoarchaeota archaeon]